MKKNSWHVSSAIVPWTKTIDRAPDEVNTFVRFYERYGGIVFYTRDLSKNLVSKTILKHWMFFGLVQKVRTVHMNLQREQIVLSLAIIKCCGYCFVMSL